MNFDRYKLEWFLVVVADCVLAVYGAALRDDAEKSAAKHGGSIVWIGGYGMPFHAGDRWTV